MGKREIALLGYYGEGNFGDDILAFYLLDFLTSHFSPEKIIITAPQKCYLENWFPGIYCTSLAEIYSHIPPIRRIIFGGGGVFFCFPKNSFNDLYGFKRATAYRYWRKNLNKKAKIKYYAFGVGVGPLVGIGAKLVTRLFLQKFDYISVRDEVSYKLLTDIGITKQRLTADPSHSLLNLLPPKIKRKAKIIRIIIRDWHEKELCTSIVNNLILASKKLKDNNWKVEFISFQDIYDLRIIMYLKENGENIRIWLPNKCNIVEFFHSLNDSQIIISMRAHGIYLASFLAIPSIAIGIEPKLRITAKNCHVGNFVLQGNFEVDELINMVNDVINYNGIKNYSFDKELQKLKNENNYLLEWLSNDNE